MSKWAEQFQQVNQQRIEELEQEVAERKLIAAALRAKPAQRARIAERKKDAAKPHKQDQPEPDGYATGKNKVVELLGDGPAKRSAIKEGVKLTDYSFKVVIEQLLTEGRIVKIGRGPHTKYAVPESEEKASAPADPANNGEPATVRVMNVIEENGSVLREQIIRDTELEGPLVDSAIEDLQDRGKVKWDDGWYTPAE